MSTTETGARLNRALGLFVSVPILAGAATAQEAVSIRLGDIAPVQVRERLGARIDVRVDVRQSQFVGVRVSPRMSPRYDPKEPIGTVVILGDGKF